MFPGIYDFSWNAGHLIFLGIFYSVLAVVLGTVSVATLRAMRGLTPVKAERARWHADFEDLPESRRHCRHELSGTVESRICPNGFDCGHCRDHARFAACEQEWLARQEGPDHVAGFAVPADRLYHRGHTWARPEGDGTWTIGLDDMGARLLANADALLMPKPGERIVANGTALRVKKGLSKVRVLSPLDGEVVEVGSAGSEWLLRVKTGPAGIEPAHLLTPAEARRWMLKEAERLQLGLAGGSVGPALADGGLPVDDLAAAIPPQKFDEVAGMMMLEP